MTAAVIGAVAAGAAVIGAFWRPVTRTVVDPPPSRKPRPEAAVVEIACIGALVGAAVLRSPTIALEGWILIHVAARLTARRRAHRHQAAQDRALLVSIDEMANGLRSGQSLDRAFIDAVERSELHDSHGLRRMQADLRAGRPLVEVLHRAGEHDDELALRPLAVAVKVLSTSGGAAGPAIERVGDTIRERMAADEEMQTQARQAVASAAVLAVLPVVFAVVAALVETDLAAFYLRSPLGACCLGAATLLTWAGWEWIDRLARAAP